MSSEQPLSFEEMQTHIAAIEKNQKSLLKFYKAQDDKEDDEKEARRAIEDPGDYEHLKSKKHMSQNDDDDKEKDAQNNKKKDEEMMAKMRRAFKAIAQEDDEDKRNNMAKAAQEMMDEHKTTKHEAQNDDDDDKKEAREEDEKKEARIASLERKTKTPIIADILKVASIINPKEIKSITKDLKTASLEEVEDLWTKHYKSFSASLGVRENQSRGTKSVPFQMNAALEGVDDEDNMYIASTPKEYSQLDTEKLMQRATEMYT